MAEIRDSLGRMVFTVQYVPNTLDNPERGKHYLLSSASCIDAAYANIHQSKEGKFLIAISLSFLVSQSVDPTSLLFMLRN